MLCSAAHRDEAGSGGGESHELRRVKRRAVFRKQPTSLRRTIKHVMRRARHLDGAALYPGADPLERVLNALAGKRLISSTKCNRTLPRAPDTLSRALDSKRLFQGV